MYLEASSVSDPSLNGEIHPIQFYFNKRFYKYTEEEHHCCHDIPSQMNIEEKVNESKILYGAEGLMLPAKAELSMAAKSKFDLFTITNLSFWDLALYHKLKLNVFAIAKEEMGTTSN